MPLTKRNVKRKEKEGMSNNAEKWIGLGRFNVGLELSADRMIRRHAIAILIRPEGDSTLALISPEV